MGLSSANGGVKKITHYILTLPGSNTGSGTYTLSSNGGAAVASITKSKIETQGYLWDSANHGGIAMRLTGVDTITYSFDRADTTFNDVTFCVVEYY